MPDIVVEKFLSDTLSPDVAVRLDALFSVESAPTALDDPVVLARLVQLLRDEEWLVRTLAVEALQASGAREAVPALEQRALDEVDDTVRASLAEALGALGRHSSIAPLATLFERGDAPVRAFAIAAIGQLGHIDRVRELLRGEQSGRVLGIGRVTLLRSGEVADAQELCGFLAESAEDECEILFREIQFVAEDCTPTADVRGLLEVCLASVAARFPSLARSVATTREALRRSL